MPGKRVNAVSTNARSLFRRLTLAEVVSHVACGLRWLWFNPCLRVPTAAALVSRRRPWGTPVMRHLFQRVCHPGATEQTTGAFRFGLRLMALDGTDAIRWPLPLPMPSLLAA